MSRIDDDIKKGTFSHTYLLYGTENYLKDNDCLKLRRALTNEGDTMNCTRFEGKDVSLKEILAQAETMPFFAERRLVEIHDSGLFKNAKESKDLQALIEFVKNPPETTVLVFCEEQTDARGKLYKAVQGSGTVIEYKSLKADTLSAWIAGWLGKRGRKITGSAVDELIRRTGTDMYLLSMEMNKLVDYTQGRDGIVKEDVEELCTARPEDQIFRMINAIAAKDRKRAMDLYAQLLMMNTEPVRILSLITREYNLLLQVKEMREQGFDRDAIAQKLKIRPYFMKDYLGNSSAYTVEGIKAILNQCADTEENIKTGMMKPRLAVELLIMLSSGN